MRKVKAQAFGAYRAIAVHRETGEYVVGDWQKNAIIGAGVLRWLHLIAGGSGQSLPFDNGNSRLRVWSTSDASGDPEFVTTSADTGYPQVVGDEVVWRWSHIGVEEYEALSYIFDDGRGTPTIWSRVLDSSLGSKTAAYNWIYEYKVGIELAYEEDKLVEATVQDLLRRLGGADTYTDYGSKRWDAANTRLRVYQTSPAVTGDVVCESVATAVDLEGGEFSEWEATIEWEFVSPATGGPAYHNWNDLEVRNAASDAVSLWLSEGEDLGPQPEGSDTVAVVREVTFELHISRVLNWNVAAFTITSSSSGGADCDSRATCSVSWAVGGADAGRLWLQIYREIDAEMFPGHGESTPIWASTAPGNTLSGTAEVDTLNHHSGAESVDVSYRMVLRDGAADGPILDERIAGPVTLSLSSFAC